MSLVKEIIEKCRQNSIKVLTGPGGIYEINPKLRDLLCLTSDYTLHVLKGNTFSPNVLGFRDQLRRKKVDISEPREVSLTLLQAFYSELVDNDDQIKAIDSAGSTSERQLEVINIIRDAVTRQASDIHFVIKPKVMEIEYRIHGELYLMNEKPAEDGKLILGTLYGSMCDVAATTYQSSLDQDARVKTEYVERCGLYSARVSSGPTDKGTVMVLRLLYDTNKSVKTLAQLGYLPEQIDQIETMKRRATVGGINVLSGPTGSGKSTTVSSILSDIIQNERADEEIKNFGLRTGIKVFTIEDPPEYRIPGAVQIPLHVADKSNPAAVRQAWAKSISTLVRRDPDMALIGEIRDRDSARAAFELATTGHGVYTTLHTTDAPGIMARLHGLEIDKDHMLDPDIVTGLINQSLIAKLCPHCRIPWEQGKHTIEKTTRERIEHYCDTQFVFLKGEGCEHCIFGVFDRMVVAETIIPNANFMEVFDQKGKVRAKEYWIREMGGITKCQALIRRINEGCIDPVMGDSYVCALDSDFLSLGIDYGKSGNFEAPATKAKEYWGEKPRGGKMMKLVS